MNCNIVINFEE